MSVPSGWYDDPNDPALLRYWDGIIWSSRTMPKVAPGLEQSRIGLAGHDSPPVGTDPLKPTNPSAGRQDPDAGQTGPDQRANAPRCGERPGSSSQQGQQYGQQQYPHQGQYGARGQNPWQQGQLGNQPVYLGPPRPTTPDGVPLSGWWRRVGAQLIDSLLLLVVGLPFTGYFIARYIHLVAPTERQIFNQAQSGGQPSLFPTIPADAQRQLLIVGLISLVLTLIYNLVMLRRVGSTVGMLATGISVRLRERPGPAPIDALLRRVGFVSLLGLLSAISGVGFVFSLTTLIDVLWPLWDPKNQALHDKVAATNVVMGRQHRGGAATTSPQHPQAGGNP